MRLNQNLASLNIYRQYTKVLNKQSAALGRISSGYKVNSAFDNPNVIAQSERFRIQIKGLQMANRNIQDGISMLQTADGALDNMSSTINRIKELTVQAGGVQNKEDKAIIQEEINQMIMGLDDTADNTEFNGVKLISNKDVTDNLKTNIYLDMPVGANVGEIIKIPVYNLNSSKLGETNISGKIKFLKDLDVLSETGIDDSLSIIDSALQNINFSRSKYGALENRFESNFKNVSEISDRIEGAESNIRDADVAEEMMEFSKDSILVEAGNAMMVQSNKFPQDILRILENVRAK